MTLRYQSGFGNHFSTEAVAGALPEGRNSPQRPAYGLYAEQLSGTAFTAPRDHNQRSWLYRMRPTAGHSVYQMAVDAGAQYPSALDANRMRWSPRDWPDYDVEFVDSLIPMLENGAPGDLSGVLFSTYAATHEIDRRAYFNADGEDLFIPVEGRLRIETELGVIEIEPQEVAVVPRGVRYRVRLPDGKARGYLVENRGAPFRLPDLGPIGSNGLANPRDFLTPLAWFEDRDDPFKLIQRFDRKLWIAELDHSPFDVVAWHGNLAPYKYDLRRFNTIGTVSYDHPDPSIFTVLTSPSAVPGTANADFVIFPPRWMVAEDTFRPPWFHRNVMSEAMGLIHGAYDAKADGFAPGGISLHNMMSSHGPDVVSWQGASAAELNPHKIVDTMAFMVETNRPWRATNFAISGAQSGYNAVWDGFPKARLPE